MKYLLPSELAELEHKYIIKAESPTNPEYGYYPSERPLEYLVDTGVININKVSGPSSHVISSWVKKSS